jgi:hypothetical protein
MMGGGRVDDAEGDLHIHEEECDEGDADEGVEDE